MDGICAVILAAGASKRMGVFKQLLPLGDKYLLEHVMHTVSMTGFDAVYTVIGRDSENVKEKIHPADDRFHWVENKFYKDGQSTSLKTGLKEASGTYRHAVIFLGDMPFVKHSTVESVYRAGKMKADIKTDPFIIRPEYRDRKGHPVFIGNMTDALISQLAGDSGFKHLQHLFTDSMTIETDDPGIYFDIDHPEDYEGALEKWKTNDKDDKGEMDS